jgi:hypothetical protein
MSFLWDSNILRHYLDDYPLLLENLKIEPPDRFTQFNNSSINFGSSVPVDFLRRSV